MKASAWIDKVKAARGWETDYRVAKELGFSRNTIGNFRSGRSGTMDEETAVKVAAALGVDPVGIIIDQVAERSKSPELATALHDVARGLCILCKVTEAALSKAAEALPAILMPGVKNSRTRHA